MIITEKTEESLRSVKGTPISVKGTLCLNMIVKNESRIIERLLKSVLPIVDCYCICDTGSTDNTAHIITEFFEKAGIPGKILFEPFVDFAHNRNVALQGCVGMPAEYVLLLDADMRLVLRGFDKRKLSVCDSFMILQGSEHFYYENMRIVRNNGLYTYVGVTHEFISTPPNDKKATLPKGEIFIEDIGDGGAKADKYERDIHLLLDGLKGAPDDVRYHFYLANSYYDSGKHAEAIQYYKRRIELGGWDQEVWYSYYRLGQIYNKMGEKEKAVYCWLEGYNFLPKRLENVHEIMHVYRHASKHKLVKMFYEIAQNVLQNKEIMEKEKDAFLFLHNDVYTYKIDYEYSISAAYNGVKTIPHELVRILNGCTDRNIIDNTFHNMKFYKDVLAARSTVDLTLSLEKRVGDRDVRFYSSSASILKKPVGRPGYVLNIRLVNYRINEKGHYLDCDETIITTNKFVELSADLQELPGGFQKVFDLVDDRRRYLGVEDVRIFRNPADQSISFIGTGYHANNTIGVQIGQYNPNAPLLVGRDIQPIQPSACEKNWVYVDVRGETCVVYKWFPLQLCQIDEQNAQLVLHETREMPGIFRHCRGSSCGFPYLDEIWFIVHLVSYEKPRHYYHLIAVFDADMHLLRYSAPFKFEGVCIEYSLSLIVEQDRVIIPYSTWDHSTKIGVYDKGYIDGLLHYS